MILLTGYALWSALTSYNEELYYTMFCPAEHENSTYWMQLFSLQFINSLCVRLFKIPSGLELVLYVLLNLKGFLYHQEKYSTCKLSYLINWNTDRAVSRSIILKWIWLGHLIPDPKNTHQIIYGLYMYHP